MESKTLIYIGPTISGYRLVKYQIFIDKIPRQMIDDILEKCPAIERLFVPVETLIEADKQVRTKGTPLYKFYKQALEV